MKFQIGYRNDNMYDIAVYLFGVATILEFLENLEKYVFLENIKEKLKKTENSRET